MRQKVKLHSNSFSALKTESAENGRADLDELKLVIKIEMVIAQFGL